MGKGRALFYRPYQLLTGTLPVNLYFAGQGDILGRADISGAPFARGVISPLQVWTF